MPAKKTIIKKKKTKQKQKQKQKQVQNVIVNVNQSRARRSNNTPKDKPQSKPQSQSVNVMPAHHTFYVDTGRPQYNTLRALEPTTPLRASEPVVAPSLTEPESGIAPLETEEEKVEAEVKRRGRPPGVRNRPKLYAEAVPEAVEAVEYHSPLSTNIRRIISQNRNVLENTSDEEPHQGLSISSSSLMNQPSSEDNLSDMLSSSSGGAVQPMKYEEPNYNDYRVVDLKEILRGRNLKVSGNKAELISRLESYDKMKNTPLKF